MSIDDLRCGDKVRLRFMQDDGHSHTEPATFIQHTGEGDDREAVFLSSDGAGGTYSWEAYRYEGHWAYGTGADELRVLG